jgi:hypothetical protein
VDPLLDPLIFKTFGRVGTRTPDLWVCSQELWPLDHRSRRIYIHTYIYIYICLYRFRIYEDSDEYFARVWRGRLCVSQKCISTVPKWPPRGTRETSNKRTLQPAKVFIGYCIVLYCAELTWGGQQPALRPSYRVFHEYKCRPLPLPSGLV